MDDLELEARLRTHLHHRLDHASPVARPGVERPAGHDHAAAPRGLRAAQCDHSGSAGRRLPLRSSSWSARSGSASSSAPSARAPSRRRRREAAPYRTVCSSCCPPPGFVPTKPDGSLAVEVLNARVHALGIGNFTSAVGYGIEFIVPQGGPSDAAIRDVLTATGDLRIVPLPTTDYGDGKLAATIGEPLPKDEPALVEWDGIASVASDPLAGTPDLTITLKPAAAQAFDDYTAAHVGDSFAIVIDGRVALLPAIMDATTIGQITVSPGSAESFREPAAILVGGMLPEAGEAPPPRSSFRARRRNSLH